MQDNAKHDNFLERSLWGVAILVAVLVCLLLVATAWGLGRREDVRCSRFFTQGQAQDFFSIDPTHYQELDADHDDRACESLPKQ